MSRENYKWPFDPLLAKQLGFDYFAVGGSRSYNAEGHLRLAKTDEQQDWDLIGIVKTKKDILSLILGNAPRLNSLLGISLAENVRWQALSESDNTGWTVLRYSGFAKDNSKRSLKIISYDEMLSILVEPTAVDIGVLSGRIVRKFSCCHPLNGRVKIVYQPSRYSEDLCILHDVDLVCLSGDQSMAFAGVTIDLFLTSTPVLDVFPEITKRLVRKFLHKWATTTNSPSHLPLVPTLHGSQNFDTCFAERLQMMLRKESEGLPQHKRDCSRLWSTHLVSGRNKRFEFWPLKQDYWVDSFLVPALPQKELLYARPVEFVLDPHQQYSPSPFTSNSTGGFGKIRLPHKAEWESAFMKRSTQAPFEISALVDVQRYFPKDRAQEVLAVDNALGIIYFRVYQGITLNEHRLACHTSAGLRNGKVQNHVVDGFLDIELQRAEQVTNVYRKTMTMDALPSQCDRQRIHRFYYQRLFSDNRLREFYEKSISSICNHQIGTLSDFLDMQVHINGVACASLRSIFDKALAILDPHSATGLSSLPVAFGLGDSHGGNIMINPDNFPAGYIHIDYEVSGLHCPFLDMAKGIYLDGFFNALYADLLTNSIVGRHHESGTMVTWDIRDNILYIDYEFEVDEIGEVAGFTKLEYIFRPTLEYMMRHSLSSSKLAVDILSSALLCCAILTRDFSERPDVFFLNLALGVDLADNMMAVFRKAFQWNPPLHWPSLNSEVGNCLVGEGLPSSTTISLLEQEVISLIASSGLIQDDVFLKRAEDTFQMHKRFSGSKDESQGQIIQRIDHVRRLGMKIAPHTCIRESIFAEPRVDHHFAYQDILTARSKDDSLVDVGCCMGSDIRKLILDGYPSQNITGLDIERRFFELGRMLYNEKGPQNGPHFLCADLTDRNFTSTHSNLTRRFKFVHTANVLHLFDVGKQEVFFRNLIFMTAPGGIIWGRQVGLAPDHLAQHRQPLGKGYRFTLKEFRDWCLNIGGWEAADAQFDAQLVEYDEIRGKRLDKNWVLQWRVAVPKSRGKDLS